jgi:hypothetical protein
MGLVGGSFDLPVLIQYPQMRRTHLLYAMIAELKGQLTAWRAAVLWFPGAPAAAVSPAGAPEPFCGIYGSYAGELAILENGLIRNISFSKGLYHRYIRMCVFGP